MEYVWSLSLLLVIEHFLMYNLTAIVGWEFLLYRIFLLNDFILKTKTGRLEEYYPHKPTCFLGDMRRIVLPSHSGLSSCEKSEDLCSAGVDPDTYHGACDDDHHKYPEPFSDPPTDISPELF